MSRLFSRIPIVVAVLLLAAQQAWAADPKEPVKTEKLAAKIDLNRATLEQLQELPGIGEAYSKKIMAGRPYKSIKDLSKVGIPAATVKKITPLVVVNTPKKPPKKRHGLGEYGYEGLPQGRQPVVRQHRRRQMDD